jgi:endonuclease III
VVFHMISLAERKTRALKLIKILRKATKSMPQQPMSQLISEQYNNDPFLILISCLLSLRARDVVTYPICVQLFKKARTPEQFIKMPLEELEKTIHSIGFFRNKARTIKSVSKELLDRFDGKVPSNEYDLLSIKGIGRKTANLVLGVAFGQPAICVDTHVHKLSNKLGIVTTKTPEQTEFALQEVLPKKYWTEYNKLLVMCGQNMQVCKSFLTGYLDNLPKKGQKK